MAKIYIDDIINKVRALHQSTLDLDKSDISIGQFLALQAQQILQAHQDGNVAVKFHLACWCKPLISKSTEGILQYPLTIEHTQQTIAAEHGFTNWQAVKAQDSTAFDLAFENCVDSMLNGDIEYVASAIAASPSLVTQRSQYGHKATLLHYIGANGVESYRQYTPFNAAAITQLLIDHGADPDADANIYGGSKPIELVLSSAHPINAGVAESIAEVLRRR